MMQYRYSLRVTTFKNKKVQFYYLGALLLENLKSSTKMGRTCQTRCVSCQTDLTRPVLRFLKNLLVHRVSCRRHDSPNRLN
ncbi:hypothetical protein YC2023_006581 [Brassica napus]